MADHASRIDFWSLLTSFHGRINRLQWWIGSIILLVLSFTVTWSLNPNFFSVEELPPTTWPETLWQLALCVPFTALTVKRFNDRDWPWWLGYAFMGTTIIDLIAPHFGCQIAPDAHGMNAVAFWGLLMTGLLALIDNGFVRGTDGPNRHGPDPLTPGSPVVAP